MSSIMFNTKKPENVVEVKKESTVVKLCYAKYIETKNASYTYIMSISNKIKNKSSSLLTHLSFFKFNENCKYTNFPWYARLYFILKDNINQLIEYKNNETPVNVSVVPSEIIPSEVVQSEKQTPEKKVIEENNAYSHVANYDFNIQNSYSATYAKRQSSSSYRRIFKRTNSECLVEKDNDFNNKKSYSNRIALSAKNGTISIINSFMSFNKSSPVVVTNEKISELEETVELVETNEKEEINIVVENVSENVVENAITENFITEEASKPNEMNSSIIEKKGLTTGIKNNFKNAWSTFNNFIA